VTVAILYGFSEGPGLGGAFLRTLKQNGFEIIADPRQADVIVAHSGGCYLVPEESAAKLVVLIGESFWPGRPLLGRVIRKMQLDTASYWRAGHFIAWTIKQFWHSIYFWDMPRNLAMWRRQQPKTWPILAGKKVVHIRYKDDAFCTPAISKAGVLPGAEFVTLPGQHDELWIRPEQTLAVMLQMLSL